MSVFLLGPSRDGQGDGPLAERRRLARRMQATGAAVALMEDEPDRTGETHLGKFRRLVHDHAVHTFALYVPLAARLHGLSVEVGHLLTRIEDGDLSSARVHLLLQERAAGVDDDGMLALSEPGNRTRYYEDLMEQGCRIHAWTDQESLDLHALAVAMEAESASGHNP